MDANQADIVAALRKAGASVTLLHAVGMGCPDILVGYRGLNLLMEIKDGLKPAHARGLTSFQVDWHADWRGQVCVVESEEAALAQIGVVL